MARGHRVKGAPCQLLAGSRVRCAQKIVCRSAAVDWQNPPTGATGKVIPVSFNAATGQVIPSPNPAAWLPHQPAGICMHYVPRQQKAASRDVDDDAMSGARRRTGPGGSAWSLAWRPGALWQSTRHVTDRHVEIAFHSSFLPARATR